MSEYITVIHDAATGETIEREMTPDEIADLEKYRAEAAEADARAEAERAAAQAARESALAKLAALGLTEEEAAAIIK